LFRGIVQCLAQAIHSFVQAQIEIDECPRRPQSLAEFLTADHHSRSLQQSRQNLERFFLENDVMAIGAKFGGAQVEFEIAKADDVCGFGWIRHRRVCAREENALEV
jgi:hypothetical protein